MTAESLKLRCLLVECAKMLRRGQKACERQGWERGESTEHWYHAAGQLAAQIEINYGKGKPK
jgi:hypothetical protein